MGGRATVDTVLGLLKETPVLTQSACWGLAFADGRFVCPTLPKTWHARPLLTVAEIIVSAALEMQHELVAAEEERKMHQSKTQAIEQERERRLASQAVPTARPTSPAGRDQEQGNGALLSPDRSGVQGGDESSLVTPESSPAAKSPLRRQSTLKRQGTMNPKREETASKRKEFSVEEMNEKVCRRAGAQRKEISCSLISFFHAAKHHCVVSHRVWLTV